MIQPVEFDGHIVLPMDSELRGTIARMRRGGVGLSHETAQLDLRFDTLILPRSQPQPLAGLVAGRAHRLPRDALPQPDYWTKSYPTLRKEVVEDPGDSLRIKPLQKFGPLRQQGVTAGVGISF